MGYELRQLSRNSAIQVQFIPGGYACLFLLSDYDVVLGLSMFRGYVSMHQLASRTL